MAFWHRSPRKKLEQLLDEGSRALEAGDPAGARRIFQALIDQAETAGDEELRAAGLQRRGVTRDLLGDSHGAEQDVRAALAIDLQLQGRDGDTVRQDHFTLGIILSGRGDSLAAEAPFLESARIAGIRDQDAHYRAIHNVVAGRLARGDHPGAGALLWELRPGADGPRFLVGSLDAPVLARLLLEQNRLDEVFELVGACSTADGYWFAKMKMGRIDEDTMTAILQATIDVDVIAARGLAAAGRHEEARVALELLTNRMGEDAVASLRQDLFG